MGIFFFLDSSVLFSWGGSFLSLVSMQRTWCDFSKISSNSVARLSYMCATSFQIGTTNKHASGQSDYQTCLLVDQRTVQIWSGSVMSRSQNHTVSPAGRDPQGSQSCSGWKRPVRSSSPTFNLVLTSPPPNHAAKFCFYTLLEDQGY